jgi:AAA domain
MNIPAPTPLAETLAHIEPFRPKGIGLAEATALCPIGLEDFLTRPFPIREMVCAPWLPVSGLAMLYAPRGVGKTHVALALAYAVASGGRFLKWHAPKARRVLVIDGEMPAATLQERLLTISQGSTLKPPSDDYLRILASDLEANGLPDLSSAEGQMRYGQILDLADLIIIDNISTLCRSGRENDAESWLPVQSWALAQRRANRSVLFVHHGGKGGAQRGIPTNAHTMAERNIRFRVLPARRLRPQAVHCRQPVIGSARSFSMSLDVLDEVGLPPVSGSSTWLRAPWGRSRPSSRCSSLPLETWRSISCASQCAHCCMTVHGHRPQLATLRRTPAHFPVSLVLGAAPVQRSVPI